MVSQMFDTLADVVAKTGGAVTKAVWQTLGYPSEQAWRDAGSPSTKYVAPVFGSPLNPAATYKPEASTTSEGSGLVVPAAEDVRLSSEDPFTSGLSANLFGKAKEDLGGLAVRQQLADEQANTMTGMEQVETLMNPFAQSGAGGFEMTQPTYGSRSEGTLRGEGLQSGAIRGDYSSVAQGLQDPQALALLGGGLVLPELAALLGAGPMAAAGFAAPRVSQETLGLENLPGVELGNMARENLPGLLGTGVGGALEFGLDPMTLAGAGLGGTRALPNLLGRGTLSPAQYASGAALGGAGSAVGGEVAGTPGAVAGGLLGGVAGLWAPRVGAAAGRAAVSGVESMGDVLQTGTRGLGGVSGYGAGLTPGADDDLSALLAQSLNIGKTQGRDALVKQGGEAAQDVAAQMRAGSAAAAQPFRETANLRRTARDLSSRLDEMKQSITERLGPGEAGAIRVPGGASTPGGTTPKPTSISRVPQSLDDLTKIAQEEKYLRGGGTAPLPEPTPPGTSWWSEAMGVLGAPRTVMASSDLGAITRQGQRLGWAEPSAWKDAAAAGVRALGSEDAALAAQAATESNPYFKFAKDAGLKFYKWGDDVLADERAPSFTGMNESKVSGFLSNLPLISQGERGHATLLNVQGMQVFEKYAQAMWNQGVREDRLYRDLATVINHARGYGTGSMTDAMSSMNIFFSARNMNSLWQTLADPFTKSGSLLQPSARQLAAKSLASMIAGQTAMLGFLGITGGMTGQWSVSMDPTDSDFGKVQIGNTRLDTLAGYGPIVRLVSRAATVASDATLGTDLAPDWRDIRSELVAFFRNKLGPAPGIAASLVAGKDWKGDDFGVADVVKPEALAEMFMPMIVSSAIETVRGNEGAEKALLGLALPAEFVGLGASTYESRGDMRNEGARELFDMDYADLPPFAQAQVHKQLASEGKEIDDDTRAGPYIAANTGALKIAQQRLAGDAAFAAESVAFLSGVRMQDFDLGKFSSYSQAQRAFMKTAQERGATRMQATGAWEDFAKGLGIPEVARMMREDAIREDPEIVDALINLFESGQSDFEPAGWAIDLATELKASQ